VLTPGSVIEQQSLRVVAEAVLMTAEYAAFCVKRKTFYDEAENR